MHTKYLLVGVHMVGPKHLMEIFRSTHLSLNLIIISSSDAETAL